MANKRKKEIFYSSQRGKKAYETFKALPERAKETFFECLDLSFRDESPCVFQTDPVENVFGPLMLNDYAKCKSDIEVLFNFAFDLLANNTCTDIEYIELERQYEIDVGDKKYYADFAISIIDNATSEAICTVLVECDGHAFHSTKEQIKHDNEREFAIKMAGYDVLHFSGSQIYASPLKCARYAIEYLAHIEHCLLKGSGPS